MRAREAELMHQDLPATGPEREALREKGQFWTPPWVAEAMVAYAVAGGTDVIFDPAVGAGAFFKAAKTIARETNINFKLLGTEIDPSAITQAREAGLEEVDLQGVVMRDFVLKPPRKRFKAIVANPPYIRHHRLSRELKAELRAFSTKLIGTVLDGRAGYHIFFLLRALQRLDKDGRLAFIMSADTCEGVFANTLWTWITMHFRLDGVVTFSPEASPFPGVDTNAVVFLIRNAEPMPTFQWAKCMIFGTPQLKHWMQSDLTVVTTNDLVVYDRQVIEGLRTGLSREPVEAEYEGPRLSDFAKVVRGIATGANEFFFLTKKQANQLGIPHSLLKPAIGRTRDATGDQLTLADLEALDAAGRPTLLFALDGMGASLLPESVRDYLKYGEEQNIHKRVLISTRRPWYKMEVRKSCPILFAYLGRRNARFIRNLANAMPLTGFLCIYPKRDDDDYVDKLWRVLNHPDTIANLYLVGKSYGAGAIKVEPRSLEKLPLPAPVVQAVGLCEAVKSNDACEQVYQASFEFAS